MNATLNEVPIDLWRLYASGDHNYLMFVDAVVDETVTVREQIARERDKALKA